MDGWMDRGRADCTQVAHRPTDRPTDRERERERIDDECPECSRAGSYPEQSSCAPDKVTNTHSSTTSTKLCYDSSERERKGGRCNTYIASERGEGECAQELSSMDGRMDGRTEDRVRYTIALPNARQYAARISADMCGTPNHAAKMCHRIISTATSFDLRTTTRK